MLLYECSDTSLPDYPAAAVGNRVCMGTQGDQGYSRVVWYLCTLSFKIWQRVGEKWRVTRSMVVHLITVGRF
jgi:hypothetical protein